MNLSLKPSTRRMIQRRLKAGEYSSPEELVHAGLLALEQQERWGDFERGELNALIEEGERSIKQEGTIDAARVFADLRRHRQRRRRTRKAG